MVDIVCLGQFTADVVVTPVERLPDKGKALFVDRISLQNGGCACNTAVALGRLGIGTAVIGKVGDDAFGHFLIQMMKEMGLDTSAMVQDPSVNTSTTAVLVSPDGERSFLHDRGGNARMTEENVDYEVVRKAKILHVAAAFLVAGLDGPPMARVLRRAREMGVRTCLDTAWDPDGGWMEVLEPCLSHVDMFIPSLEEARMLSREQEPREIASRFLRCGIETVVIKLGTEGCYARTQDGEFSVPVFKVASVKDTLGAGDSFVAGFLAGMVNDWDVERSCRLANAVGACSVGASGTSAVRSLAETIELYQL